MADEWWWWTGRDLEGERRDLIWGTIITFTLDGLRQNIEILNDNSQCPEQDANRVSPEYWLVSKVPHIVSSRSISLV
jgi:hypothetical protein